MNKKIIIINGSGGVGKDTFVDMVRQEIYNISGSNCRVYQISDPVKAIAEEMGWEGGKTEKDRKFLSDLKVLWSEYNDGPFERMDKAVKLFKHDAKNDVLFLFMREPAEIKRASEMYDALTVVITSDRVDKIESNMADKNVMNYNYDVVIRNNLDTEHLEDTARSFAQKVVNGII